MRYILTILLFLLNFGNTNDGDAQKAGMRQYWWSIRTIYVPGNPPPPPVLGPIGYGVNATGSLPGDPVITVVNNNGNTSVGSLYWAMFLVNGATGNTFSRKKIVFNIPGTGVHTINVAPANRLNPTQFQNITMDGGTQDIEITSSSQNGISFETANCNHLIIENLYFVNCGSGDVNSGADGLNVVDGAHDICITNCCAYGNTDGNIDIGVQTFNITMQYTIIGDHLSNKTKGTGGTLINGTEVTIHHNLFNLKSVVEGERGPFLHGNYSNAYADIRNNIDYNFGRAQATGSGFGTGIGYNKTTSDCACRGEANVVNNYYYTPSTDAAPDAIDVAIDNRQGAVYSNGNISGNGINLDAAQYRTQNTPFNVPVQYQIPVETACASVHNVLTYVGPATKNATAATLIAQVTNLGSCLNTAPMLPDFRKMNSVPLPWENSKSVSITTRKAYQQFFKREEEIELQEDLF